MAVENPSSEYGQGRSEELVYPALPDDRDPSRLRRNTDNSSFLIPNFPRSPCVSSLPLPLILCSRFS